MRSAALCSPWRRGTQSDDAAGGTAPITTELCLDHSRAFGVDHGFTLWQAIRRPSENV